MSAAINNAMRLARGQELTREGASQGANIAFGFVLAAVLLGACVATPKWPLRPIGIFFGSTWYGQRVWWSFLFGWILKVTITRMGGARGYRAMRPLCLGLIMGEAFAFMLWAIVPLLRILAGAEPAQALRMPPIM